MKKSLFPIIILITIFYGCLSAPIQNNLGNTSFEFGRFTIPPGAELLESTEFKNNGIPYLVEQRYRLPSGQIMYAYYDVEGSSSVTIQRIEEIPILALGTDVNISGMPGYREFFFGTDRMQLVQFIKIMRLGWQRDFRGGIRTPSLGDHIFNPSSKSSK